MPIIFMDCVRFLINLVLGCVTTVAATYVLLFTFSLCFSLISQLFYVEEGGSEDE